MRLGDIFEFGEAGPLPLIALGVLSAPYFVPSLRPELGGILKASAKLFLEAELGADNELTDQLVDRSIDALLRMMPDGTDEERRSHIDGHIDRFFLRAHAAAHRRGFNAEDAKRRYHKHLSRMESGLQQSGNAPVPAVAHALHRIATERTRPQKR